MSEVPLQGGRESGQRSCPPLLGGEYRGTSLIRNRVQGYLAHKKQSTGVPRS